MFPHVVICVPCSDWKERRGVFVSRLINFRESYRIPIEMSNGIWSIRCCLPSEIINFSGLYMIVDFRKLSIKNSIFDF